MRTIVPILLVTLLALTQTPLGQLIKLPILVEHFYKHKQQDGVSLLEFLTDHYASEHKDDDQSEDERLPFKTITWQEITLAVLPGVVKTDFSVYFEMAPKSMLPDFYNAQQHLCKIFHPPRV